MGALHKGHELLIKKAKKKNKFTIVSIFINPKQFNSKADFNTYPKNLKKDLKILKKLKVKYVFLPNYDDIFSFKTKNKIYLHPFSNKLCGKFRPGHFKGVIDVVNRLLELIKPRYIFLGKKDYQQLYLIKKHIKKRKIKCKIIECKTIRESNGVALSTRNSNLDENQIKIASKIYFYLYNLKKKIKKNYNLFNLNKIKKDLKDLGASKIDYLESYNTKILKKLKDKAKNSIYLLLIILKTYD